MHKVTKPIRSGSHKVEILSRNIYSLIVKSTWGNAAWGLQTPTDFLSCPNKSNSSAEHVPVQLYLPVSPVSMKRLLGMTSSKRDPQKQHWSPFWYDGPGMSGHVFHPGWQLFVILPLKTPSVSHRRHGSIESEDCTYVHTSINVMKLIFVEILDSLHPQK